MLILCSGVRTDKPFVFPFTGRCVYSIEELCYYIGNHIYFIDEATFSDTLIDWIGTELKLPERADKLRYLKKHHADIKTLITAVLCSADYYTEQEIKSFLKMIDEFYQMEPIKRRCIRAKAFLEKGKYKEAVGEYETILRSKEAESLSIHEYGDLLHNLAVCRVHTTGMGEAADLFLEAYERNKRKESLQGYLYTICMKNENNQMPDHLKEEPLVIHLLDEAKSSIDLLSQEAENCDGVNQLRELKDLSLYGRKDEFYKKADEIIYKWMSFIRNT